MQELLLRKEIYGLMASGQKRSTSRKGKRDIVLGPLLFKMTEDEGVQTVVNVTSVRYIPYSDLTDIEAKQEGYNTVQELRDVLEHIYGEISPDEPFTLVEW